jgi:hypothetical protein
LFLPEHGRSLPNSPYPFRIEPHEVLRKPHAHTTLSCGKRQKPRIRAELTHCALRKQLLNFLNYFPSTYFDYLAITFIAACQVKAAAIDRKCVKSRWYLKRTTLLGMFEHKNPSIG